jgi:hypothetical protein
MENLMKCKSQECPIKETCFRYIQDTTEWWEVKIDLEPACNLTTGFNRWVCNDCMESGTAVCNHFETVLSRLNIKDVKYTGVLKALLEEREEGR